jgi:AcrR family transcriptional regulator
MPPNATATRDQLVAAAELLFAERGIDGVSLREINAAAGQRNSTALQYHFGGREGLVRAVLVKHGPEIESRRHQLLDAYEAGGHPVDESVTARKVAVRELAGALVRPLATKLADPDGGRAYLQVSAQLINRSDFVDPGRHDRRDSIHRWRSLVGPLLPDVAVKRLHHRFTAIRITYVELARRAGGPVKRDERLFTAHLVDMVTAILEAELSDETARLLDERARRR